MLIAPGKINGVTLFYSQTDINVEGSGCVFVDGHTQGLAEWEMTKRFPLNGTVTDETWFIKPRRK